jgi:hypothetical protein
MKKLFLILSFSFIAYGQGTTYFPGGSVNPPFYYNAGIPNAVNRTFTSKLSDLPSVKDFGAYCDGVHDDTIAFQNSINSISSPGQAIFVPGGVCLISGTVHFTGLGDTLFGEGSLIVLDGGNNQVGFSVENQHVSIENLIIEKSIGSSGVIAIQSNPTHNQITDYLTLDDINVVGNPGDMFSVGIQLLGGSSTGCSGNPCTSQNDYIRAGSMSYCGTCLQIGDSSPIGVDYINILDTSFAIANTAINIVSGQYPGSRGLHTSGITGTALIIGSNSSNGTFISPNYANNTGTYDVSIASGSSNNLFYASIINHARISDSGTNTSYISSVELTTGAASAINGHFGTVGGVPVISACGTSPSIASNANDHAGKFTVGSGSVTSCTVTFAVAYTNPPSCVFQVLANLPSQAQFSISDTAITMTGSITINGAPVNYICSGK